MKKCYKCQVTQPLDNFHKDKSKAQGRAGCCKKCAKAYDDSKYQKNKEKIKARAKRHYNENKEEILFKQKNVWYRDRNKNRREKYKNDLNYKLEKKIRQFSFRVTKAVKEEKQLRSLDYLGCTLDEFKSHIESQWQEGMSWDNHAHDGWHIDHIKPLSWFIKNSDDPWQANHYTNLQPLWATDNFKKHKKIL